jgi:predicted nucleic acid-binding protein
MEPALLGVVLDSSVLIDAERRKLTAAEAVESVQKIIGEVPVVLSALTVAEVGHGIYRANTPEIRERRPAVPGRTESGRAGLPSDGGRR